jgi:hypothetical protein
MIRFRAVGLPMTLLLCALILGVLYPLQCGRAWRHPIFPPPAHLNVDAADWIDIATRTPFLSVAPPMRMSRPLYPVPVYFVKKYIWQGLSALVGLRLVNLIWIAMCLVMLYDLTWLFSGDRRAACLAPILFCCAPAVQIYASQPIPESVGWAASLGPIWAVARIRTTAGARQRTSFLLWFTAGLFAGVLMLGKEVYAVYLALLVVGVAGREWRPTVLFGLGAIIMQVGWMAWVRWGIARPYSPYGANAFNFVSWLWTDYWHRNALAKVDYAVRLAARAALRTLQAFEFWPVGFAVVAYTTRRLVSPFVLVAYAGAFYLMYFAMNLVTPRIGFLFFPAIYPAAAIGILEIRDRCGKRKQLLWLGVMSLIIAAVVAGTLLDPFSFFYYG